jgi:hypothetical protein
MTRQLYEMHHGVGAALGVAHRVVGKLAVPDLVGDDPGVVYLSITHHNYEGSNVLQPARWRCCPECLHFTHQARNRGRGFYVAIAASYQMMSHAIDVFDSLFLVVFDGGNAHDGHSSNVDRQPAFLRAHLDYIGVVLADR